MDKHIFVIKCFNEFTVNDHFKYWQISLTSCENAQNNLLDLIQNNRSYCRRSSMSTQTIRIQVRQYVTQRLVNASKMLLSAALCVCICQILIGMKYCNPCSINSAGITLFHTKLIPVDTDAKIDSSDMLYRPYTQYNDKLGKSAIASLRKHFYKS